MAYIKECPSVLKRGQKERSEDIHKALNKNISLVKEYVGILKTANNLIALPKFAEGKFGQSRHPRVNRSRGLVQETVTPLATFQFLE